MEVVGNNYVFYWSLRIVITLFVITICVVYARSLVYALPTL